jgi:hypothetical protein
MAVLGATPRPETKPKGTSIGRGHLSTSSMNKRKKANYKKYRGQGK